MKRSIICVISILFLIQPSFASVPVPESLEVRVIDVGAGLCCVVKMPGDKYIIYDAGNYSDRGASAIEGIKEVIPEGNEVELLVLSHSDADHLGAVDEICDTYKIKRIIRSGLQRTTQTWRTANAAIREEKQNDGAIDINLKYFEYPAGATYRFGKTFVTMVCGFHKPPTDWDIKNQSERRNAGSIVIRIEYAGKAILFCGDSVGRHIGDAPNICLAAEKFMVENSPVIKLKSDVVIAPHHGADNGSSTAFIQKVQPRFVIFSAGHKHKHPRASTAQRYLDNGVQLQNIFRTNGSW